MTFARATPVDGSVADDSIVATAALSEVKLNVTPAKARPYSSNARAVNWVVCPAATVIDSGEIVVRVRCPGQSPKGAPSILSPGERRRAQFIVEWRTKGPVISGERVSDCRLLPSSPVAPPYENCVIRLPAASRTRIVSPELVSDKPLCGESALKTCAQPNTGSFGLKFPPPKTTTASPARTFVAAGKVKRVVSFALPLARVLMVQPLSPVDSLALALTNSTNSSCVPSRIPS